MEVAAYIEAVENGIALAQAVDAKRVTQFDDALSDHLPVVQVVVEGTTIMTWNIWNPAYAKYITPNTSDNQGLAEAWFVQEENRKEREDKILAHVLLRAQEGVIVCLQEVWPALHSKMRKWESDHEHEVEVHTTFVDDKNMNVTIFNTRLYTFMTAMSVLQRPAWDLETAALVFKKKATDALFTVLNVHVGFGKNERLFRAIQQKQDLPRPLFVCGDFNMSSRRKRPVEGDHISVLAEILPEARLAGPTNQGYTHCNHRGNVETVQDQLDAFDHIVIIN